MSDIHDKNGHKLAYDLNCTACQEHGPFTDKQLQVQRFSATEFQKQWRKEQGYTEYGFLLFDVGTRMLEAYTMWWYSVCSDLTQALQKIKDEQGKQYTHSQYDEVVRNIVDDAITFIQPEPNHCQKHSIMEPACNDCQDIARKYEESLVSGYKCPTCGCSWSEEERIFPRPTAQFFRWKEQGVK